MPNCREWLTISRISIDDHFFLSLFLSLSAATHSLKYFYTAVSGVSDFPEFTAVGLVDDGQFMYFDSNTMKAVPKTEWMRRKEGADYWERETQILIGTHQVFKNNIHIAKDRFNQSAGKLITNPLTHTNDLEISVVLCVCEWIVHHKFTFVVHIVSKTQINFFVMRQLEWFSHHLFIRCA